MQGGTTPKGGIGKKGTGIACPILGGGYCAKPNGALKFHGAKAGSTFSSSHPKIFVFVRGSEGSAAVDPSI
jgi:hypothetical protein